MCLYVPVRLEPIVFPPTARLCLSHDGSFIAPQVFPLAQGPLHLDSCTNLHSLHLTLKCTDQGAGRIVDQTECRGREPRAQAMTVQSADQDPMAVRAGCGCLERYRGLRADEDAAPGEPPVPVFLESSLIVLLHLRSRDPCAFCLASSPFICWFERT